MIENPGPELNRAVAEAIGCQLVQYSPYEKQHYVIMDEVPSTASVPVPFSPSTDLNDAFAAAERVGLFLGNYCYLGPCSTVHGKWGIYEEDMSTLRKCLAAAPTPALAICEAILAITKAAAEAREE